MKVITTEDGHKVIIAHAVSGGFDLGIVEKEIIDHHWLFNLTRNDISEIVTTLLDEGATDFRLRADRDQKK